MSKRVHGTPMSAMPHSEIILGHPEKGMSADEIARTLRLLEHEAARGGQRFLAHLIGVAAREACNEDD